MNGLYDLLNGWADSLGLALTFDSLSDVAAFVVPTFFVGWFLMHLIFDD